MDWMNIFIVPVEGWPPLPNMVKSRAGPKIVLGYGGVKIVRDLTGKEMPKKPRN
jgi:hypothetical protein